MSLQPGEVMTPVMAESRESTQRQAELEHAAFVAAIGLYRGIDEAEVRRRYGTGGVFTVQEALERGAADKVMPEVESRQWLVSQV